MKNSIKRAQSQARLSFAKREKSRLLAKTILTLVALLAVTTGAWADETPLVTIVNSGDNTTFTNGSKTFDDKVTVTFSGSVDNDGDETGWYSYSARTLTVTAAEGYTITSCKFYTFDGTAANGYTVEGESPSVCLSAWQVLTDDKSVTIGEPGVTKIEVYGVVAPSGPEVSWDKAKKTGTFTMPGGNVELEPEYYPQAALTAAPTAINDVPATTDGAIVNPGTVKNIDGTTTAQGTVMYYVSKTEMTDAALLALAADQWKADVPTAESLAQGQAYVYYYVRGNDSDTDEENFSDGDILAANALTVTIAAAPTYAVTFAEGTADADKWTIEPTEAKPNTEIKATYSGTKRVKSVKAVKKAEAPSLVIEDKNNYFGIGNQKFYFTEGETWTEAMANHPENAAAGWVIYNDRLRFKPDVYGYAIFILRSGDYYIIEDTILNQPIDTSKTYMFEGTNPT